MKLQQHFIVCIWALVAACSSADRTRMQAVGSNYALDATPPSDEAFKKQPAATILNFLQWYRANAGQLKKIEMVSHSTNPDSAMYYVMNPAGIEQYLGKMQRSGFVSEKYIDKWRAYFSKCNEELRKTPQTEGPVKGMDFDFVMLSKDCDEDLASIEKSSVEYQGYSVDEGSIVVGLPTAGRLKYKIEKQNGKWLIDDIKDLRSALDQAQND